MMESQQAHTDDRRKKIEKRGKEARAQVEKDCATDHRHARLIALVMFLVLGSAAAALICIAVLGVPQALRQLDARGLWPALLLVIAAVGAPIAVLQSQKYRARQAKRSQSEIDRIAELSIHIQKDDALADLLAFNFELMDRFVGVALAQARVAFSSCVVAASAALLVLLGGTAAALAVPQTGTQITVATLTGAGTALSAFIAHTFQKQYGAANRQMNFYYGQPLVHCYLLHAEWLAQRDLRQEKAHLVEATLEAGRYAQMYLVDMLRTDRPVKQAPAPVTPLSDPYRQDTFGAMGLR